MSAVMKKHPDVLWFVDAVSSLGGMKIEVDKLGIDFCLASSQKAIALPPGLAVASVSARCYKKAETVSGRGYYFDILELKKSFDSDETPYTPSIPHLYALKKQLERIEKEGLENRFDRHKEMASYIREWAQKNGFTMFSEEGHHSDTISCMVNTKNVDFKAIKKSMASKGYSIDTGYRTMNEKLEKAQVKLSLDLILKIQKQITEGLLPKFESGKLRERPVVVNDPRTRKVIYLPPDAKDVKILVEDLDGFVDSSRNEIDPLILAGIFHKQMVIIHPFMDGNGRTTRLATKVLLAEMGLNTFNLFSFENYYNKNVTKYFQTVGEFGNYYELTSKIDFTSWLEYFTEGVIDELLRVQKLLPEVGISPETKLQLYHIKILKFIREKGFIADRDCAKLVDRARATRALDFKRLIELGLIARKGKGKATYYVLSTQ